MPVTFSCCPEVYMPRRAVETSPERSRGPVGNWLYSARRARGLTQEQLAERAGVDTTYVGKIELGQKSPSRKVIYSLAEALVADDSDEEAVSRMLNEGLRLAGFAAEGKITHELDPDLQMIVENWDGMTPTGKRAIKSAAELALEMNRENSIGKRAE